jgi:hypothetical protein
VGNYATGYDRAGSILMFVTALFTIAKLCKQPSCPITDECIKKIRIYIHNVYMYICTNNVCIYIHTLYKQCRYIYIYIYTMHTLFVYIHIIYTMEYNSAINKNEIKGK